MPHPASPDLPAATNVLVIGGACMGTCVAYFLRRLDPGVHVTVVEPDPAYEYASTLKASGGMRRLFSCPENIEMSTFGIGFVQRFAEDMACVGGSAHVDWRAGGYLFIVPPEGVAVIEANQRVQAAHGVRVELLTRAMLKDRYPSMRVDDLGGGALSPDDGWCDPSGFLHGIRRKALELGAVYVCDRVVGIDHDAQAARGARLASGRVIRADMVVNAAGAWAAEIGAMVGMHLPITALPRDEYYFTCATPIEPLPFVKDQSRLAFRPEGAGFSGGLVNPDAVRGYRFDVNYAWFDEVMWPALAHRFPAMEAVKLQRAWSGLYEQCELDGNPIIGNWIGGLANVYVIAGFSGHGLMHAPAAGRAIAEHIIHGAYQSIDLTRLGYARVLQHAPYRERGIL